MLLKVSFQVKFENFSETILKYMHCIMLSKMFGFMSVYLTWGAGGHPAPACPLGLGCWISLLTVTYALLAIFWTWSSGMSRLPSHHVSSLVEWFLIHLISNASPTLSSLLWSPHLLSLYMSPFWHYQFMSLNITNTWRVRTLCSPPLWTPWSI